MINFKKIDEMILMIEENKIPDNSTFNQFAIEFYIETKTLTLSKYLRLNDKNSKLPKIMNTRKAGEVLFESEKNEEIKRFLSRKGYSTIPQLNYSAVMVLRKIELLENWQRLIFFFEGGRTIQEINSSLRKELLPMEKTKIENYIKTELALSESELEWLISKLDKIENNKELKRAIKKLVR